MAVNPQMNAAAAAGGMPPQPAAAPNPAPAPGGGQPPIQTAGAGGTQTTQINQIIEALKQILPQVIDERGYVNMDKLITMWPQFSQVPFQVVMQLIQQNPEILNNLISQYGLAGITVQGRMISAQELVSLGGQTGTGPGGGGI